MGTLPAYRSGRPGPVPRLDGRLAPVGTGRGARPRRHRGDLPHRVPQLLRRGCGMTAVLETDGLGKQYGTTLGAPRLHPLHPRREGRRARRAERGGQDHAAASRRRAARSDRGRDRGPRRTPGRRPGSARACRLRRPGHAHLRPAVGGQAPPHGRLPQPALGRRAGSPPDRAARPRPPPAGRIALGWPASPARPHPGHRQAARAPPARRAGRQPGPARPARVPPGAHGGRRRARGQRRALLASRRRPRAGLRLPGRARRVPRAGCRGRRRAAGLAPPPLRSPPRSDDASRRTRRSSRRATPTGRARSSSAPSDPILDPDWTVRPVPWKTSCSPTWARRATRPAAHRSGLGVLR